MQQNSKESANGVQVVEMYEYEWCQVSSPDTGFGQEETVGRGRPTAQTVAFVEELLDERLYYHNAASCPDCNSGMVRQGGCFTCPACGFGSCT